MTADCLRTDRDLTGSGAAAVRRNGDRTCRPVRHAAVAVRQRSLNLSQTASERRRPERQLRGSASGRPVPDDRYRGCVRAAGPQQQQQYRRSGSQRPQIRLESALCRPSASILARSSRNGRVEAVSLQQLAGKTEGGCTNRILTCRGRGRHAVGGGARGQLHAVSMYISVVSQQSCITECRSHVSQPPPEHRSSRDLSSQGECG